jgi:TetR/AcrR family transcriptional regulator
VGAQIPFIKRLLDAIKRLIKREAMTTASAVGTTTNGGPGTRERLLEAAILLFSEQGFAATGTRAIAARARCNVALISHYFGSKEGLLREVIVRGIATVGDELRALRAAPVPVEVRLERLIDFMVDHYDKCCQGMQIVFHQLGQAQSPLLVAIQPKILENVELLTSILEEARSANQLRDVKPRTAAVLLLGMLQYYFVTYPVTSTLIGPRSPETIAELKLHITQIFLHGAILAPENGAA